MKILVVDDEELARKRVLKLIEETETTQSIFEASSGKEAIQAINEVEPDIVFLDIQMTDMTGFDVLKKLNNDKMPIIIFVTAYDNFAIKAFEVQAIDFLLKPFKKERFFEALRRGVQRVKLNDNKVFKTQVQHLIRLLGNEGTELPNAPNKYLERIVIKLGKKYYFVDTKDIKYITSAAYYAEIFTIAQEKHVYRISMSDLIKKLSPNDFIRVNRSSILRLQEIKETISEGLGDFTIIMNDGKSFPLSKIYKEAFFQKIDLRNSL